MKTAFSAFILISFALFAGCKKQDVTPIDTAPVENSKILNISGPLTKNSVHTYILGHKGAGSNNYNAKNLEQSIASFKEGLAKLDGVEVDVEMSLDGTLWLQHATDISSYICKNGGHLRSIINMHDAEIIPLQLCSRTKQDRNYRLSELMNLWNSSPNGFYISLEIKGDFEKIFYDKVGGMSKYVTTVADKLAGELKNLKHSPKLLLIEVNTPDFLNEFKKFSVSSDMVKLLFEYKSFDQTIVDAIKYKFDGVSSSFHDATITSAKINAAQQRNLIVQMWTPYTNAEVLAVYNMHPNFIQTDNINVKTNLKIP